VIVEFVRMKHYSFYAHHLKGIKYPDLRKKTEDKINSTSNTSTFID